MNKLYLLAIVPLLLLPLVSADNLTSGLRAYYSFDTSLVLDDYTGTYNGTNNGAASTTGILGNGAEFVIRDKDYIDTNAEGAWQNAAFSVSAWVKQNGNLPATQTGIFISGDSTSSSEEYFKTGTYNNASFMAVSYDRPTEFSQAYSTVSATADTNWHHIVGVWNTNGQISNIYVDGVDYGGNAGTTLNIGTNYYFNIGGGLYWNGAVIAHGWNGTIDEFAIYEKELNSSEVALLYNLGSGCNPVDNPSGCAGVPSVPTAAERLQQDASIEQNGTVTVNSASYVPITSSSVTITDDTWLYGSATVPIIPTTANTATCRITINGAELNESETARTLTAGSIGNMLITSLQHYVSAGTYNLGLQCKRAPGGAFDVENSSIIFHILTTPSGVQLETAQLNFTSAAIGGLIGSTTITTSDNYTAAGTERFLVTEWAANYVYGATGNISIVTELAGTNCTEVKRYGASGATGSVGGLCYVGVGNETNSTAYDFKVFGTGTGTLTNAKFHIKEFILHPNEINSTSVTGLSGDGTVASVSLTVAGGHSNPDLIGQAVLSAVSTSGTQTGTWYLTADGQNSTTISRTSSVGQPGVFGVHKDFLTVSGTVALSLIGDCAACAFTGQYLLGYITSDVAATPNSFLVTANNTWGGALTEFAINLSDGRSFSTTTGSISVPATGELYNITAVENSGAAIPYFTNTTLNHNSTVDITLNLTPYTVINATYAGAKVNNFTVNGTTTTTGAVYVRVYNTTSEFTISDAVSAGGTNLSDQTQNVTASPYLQNYTFIMLTANAFNFSIIDEITETAITQNMTVEIISGASAGTYTTTDGTLYLELLTPSDYTIRYYSTLNTNYTQRDYIQTLVDRQRYEINLYGLENDEATDMVVTVKDTSGDPVEGAIVKLLRYFTSCNCYNVVEMSTTSAAGESYFIVDAYDGHYKFTVEYNGETEFISSSPENFVPSGGLVSRTITINLGSAYFQSFRALTNVARTLVYNNATKGLSFTWNDPSGIVSKGCLYAEYLDGVHYTPVTPVCQEASTGSVVLTLNNSANSFKYYAELETSTTYSEYVVFSGVIDKIRETLLQGNVGLGAFLGAGLIIVMALMFSFSAIAVVVITAIGVVGMSVLGIASLSTVFITGFATLILGLAAYLMRS